MNVKAIVLSDTYRDSVYLMKLSSEAKIESAANQISAMMGTTRNKELFMESGLSTPEVEAAKPNDLVIVVEATADKIELAVETINRLLTQEIKQKKIAYSNSSNSFRKPCATMEDALAKDPDLNLALISVSGDYARYEAAKALEMGMDVMLYSDNISLEDEITLKTFASSKGLLVMGPDCGTAILKGVPLAFANRVNRGTVGIVGASGTGLQELFCLLDRCNVGISNAYGTGGRDMKDSVGGITAASALDRLGADPNTKIIALIGKPPGDKVRVKLAEKLKSIGKPAFVHYLGAENYEIELAANIKVADDFTALALMIANEIAACADLTESDIKIKSPTNSEKGLLRGLFCGGTLCQEAAELAMNYLDGDKFSNMHVHGYAKIAASEKSRGHVFWDLGDDVFTVGRPHPMMAPELRMEHFVQELCDPLVAVILLDVVIGFGSHPDTVAEIIKTIAKADSLSNGASRAKCIVASVCGTERDNPRRKDQVLKLQEAGVVVLSSNARAAIWAAKVAGGVK